MWFSPAQLTKTAKHPPATFDTSATNPKIEVQPVAKVASVTVANTLSDELKIRRWLELISEDDPAIIHDVISKCRLHADVRGYFVKRAMAELPPDPLIDDDDRRTCKQCSNLLGRRCQAAKRGEIVASRSYEPISDLPRRCEGYLPGAMEK